MPTDFSGVGGVGRETAPPRPATVSHILNPRAPNRTWHLDLSTFELLWHRFYVAALLDGCSRRLLVLRVFRDAPTSRDMRRLVEGAVTSCGVPGFLVTDHGCQFRDAFKVAAEALGIAHVQGRVRACEINGKVERFFGTLKPWYRLTLFFWSLASVQKKLDLFREWYNAARPMFILDGRTPEEMWRGEPPPAARPYRARDPVQPAFAVRRVNYRDDPHLPTLAIRIQRTVKRVA